MQDEPTGTAGTPTGGVGDQPGAQPGAVETPPVGVRNLGEPGPATEPTWRDTLPDDLKESPTLQRFKDVPDLAKSYLEARAALGRNRVELPGPNATQEELDAFYAATGRPDAPDKYELAAQLPEGVPDDPAFVNWFKDAAYRAGLSSQQAQALFQGYMQEMGNRYIAVHEQISRETEEVERNLKNMWGQAYPQKLSAANKTFALVFGAVEGGEEFVKSSGLGRNPIFIAAMANLADKLSDDTLVGAPGAMTGALSPAEARARRDAIMQDPAYYNESDPKHNALVKEVADLLKYMGGEAAADASEGASTIVRVG